MTGLLPCRGERAIGAVACVVGGIPGEFHVPVLERRPVRGELEDREAAGPGELADGVDVGAGDREGITVLTFDGGTAGAQRRRESGGLWRADAHRAAPSAA